MRLSLRKVVVYAVYMSVFITFNVLISYNVNVWSFRNSEELSKVEKSLRLEVERRTINGGKFIPHSESEDQVNNLVDGNLGERSISGLVNQHGDMISKTSLTNVSRTMSGSRSIRNVQQVGVKTTKPSKGQHYDYAFYVVRNDESESYDTSLEDVFISVKTTWKYHQNRVNVVLQTWHRLAREQVYFFTDADDTSLVEKLGNHIINTNCSSGHIRSALNCKMAVEFDNFLASRKRWFCHVDDDVYLNVPRLLQLLKKHNYKDDWYIGKPSLMHPMEARDREKDGVKVTFWFATGGAFCISRALALKMTPYASGGRFMTTAEKIRLPDDCTLGFIIEYLLKKRLTVIEEFHSHFEALRLLQRHKLKKAITVSYSEYSGKRNIINIKGFSVEEDPTRFKSYHCFLFPSFQECKNLHYVQ